MSYYNLHAFDSAKYTFDEACKSGAIHCTNSTVDAMSIRSGMYDVEEVCQMFAKLSGVDTFTFGVVAENGEFITLDEITKSMGDEDFHYAAPADVINQLADVQKYANEQKSLALESMGQSGDAYNCIGMNTSHLSTLAQSDLNGLANTSEMIFARDTGWFVKLYDNVEDNNNMFKDSPELQHIAELALTAEYRMIEFDGDAAYYPGLKQFDGEMGEVVHFEAGQHIPEQVQKDLVSDQKLSDDDKDTRKSLTLEEFCCRLAWEAATYNELTKVTSYNTFFKTQESSKTAWPVVVLDPSDNYITFGMSNENVTVTHSKLGYTRTLKVPARQANATKMIKMLAKLTESGKDV